MESIINIKNGENIQISIYFKSMLIYDEDELDNVSLINDIQDELSPKYQVIQNNENVAKFTGIMNKLSAYIENGDMCAGLFPTYITRVMLNSHAIITIKSTTSDEIYGFAVIKFKTPKDELSYLYLEIICSHKNVVGGGHVLINTVENICKSISFYKIKLHSVKQAISFYEKYNFVKDEIGCTKISEDKSDCLMVKDLRDARVDSETDADIEYGGTNKRKGEKTKRKRGKTKRKTKRSK